MTAAHYFQTPLQQVQFYDKYSRYDYQLGRREHWPETVQRAVNFLRELSEERLQASIYRELHEAILRQDVMPSMRLIATAGDAARRQNLCIYNCSSQPVHALESFTEALTISMAGCGVGYSVEKRYVSLLPVIEPQRDEPIEEFQIPDTSEGWVEALHLGLTHWFAGRDISFDYSLIRREGTPLRTKGGQASGPRPLARMLSKIRHIILGAQGRQLRTVEAHHMMCLVGDCAVAGGVRRTAMIALFDPDDIDMLMVKAYDLKGQEHLWNANNSMCWPMEGVSDELIDNHLWHMFDARRGEPGIFNHRAAFEMMPERRRIRFLEDLANIPTFWPNGIDLLNPATNPCGEISFIRPFGLCNLSIAVARPGDQIEDLRHKVRLAAILGTIQSTATHFPGLRPMWVWNCERERLLGVDLTGQAECAAARNNDLRRELRDEVIGVNKWCADILHILPSVATTCNKPSGNSSTLLNVSPGIGGRKYRRYIRRMTLSETSPIFQVLREHNWPMEKKNGVEGQGLALFPVEAPAGAITEQDMSALDQCEMWLDNKLHWTEHNPSVTILYRDHEIPGLISWIKKHRDIIGGMTFFPLSDARFEQAPYEEIDEVRYAELCDQCPSFIDFDMLKQFEEFDQTTAFQELACSSGVCEIF